MAKLDKIETLPYNLKLRVVQAKDFLPRIARGHGSIRLGECNVPDCKLDTRHYQDRLETAYNILGF